MRGTVKTSESGGEPGTITGDDGKAYTFRQNNVRNGAVLQTGASVDFIGMGDEARDIYRRENVQPAVPMPPPAQNEPPAQQPANPAPSTPAGPASAALAGQVVGAAGVPAPSVYNPTQEPYAPYPQPVYDTSGGEQLNVWQYFVRCMTTHYAEFNGRARRSEYWGYTLFWWIILFGLMILDILFMALTAETSPGGDPWWLFFFSIIWMLGTLVPNIAVVVRRLHDLDMSGWLYLLKGLDLIGLSIGTLIIFVFTLIDGKPHPNKYGPSPKYSSVKAEMTQTFS